MSQTVAFARSSLVQIIGRVISTALGVVAVALVARYLGQAGYGHYSTVIAFLQLVAILADFGLYLTLLQELGERPAEEHAWRFGSGLALRAISSAAIFALAPVLALAFPYPAEVKAGIALMAVGFWMNHLSTLLGIVFQQRLQMTWAVLADVAGRAAFIGGTLWAISAHAGLLGILAANAGNSLVLVLVMAIAAYRLLPFKLNINWPHWRATLIKAWPIGLGIGLNLVYFKADTIILSLYRSAEEVGLYGAPYRVLEIIAAIPHMVMGLALPIMAAAWAAGNTERLYGVIQKLFDVFWLMVWPMLAGLFIVATPVMRLVAGPEFIASGPILRILALGAGAIFFGTLFSYVVLVTGQQKKMLWAFGAVAVVGCTAYLLLIPRYSYWAAAWATVGVETCIVLAAAWVACRKVALPLRWNIFLKAGLAALAMAVLLRLSGLTSALLLCSLGTAIYAALLLALGILPRQLVKDVLTLRKT